MTDSIAMREAWSRFLGLEEWAEMIRVLMDYQAKLRKIGSANARLDRQEEARP